MSCVGVCVCVCCLCAVCQLAWNARFASFCIPTHWVYLICYLSSQNFSILCEMSAISWLSALLLPTLLQQLAILCIFLLMVGRHSCSSVHPSWYLLVIIFRYSFINFHRQSPSLLIFRWTGPDLSFVFSYILWKFSLDVDDKRGQIKDLCVCVFQFVIAWPSLSKKTATF